MSTVNAAGILTNMYLGYNHWDWSNGFGDSLAVVGFFCGFYLLSTRINIRVDNVYKLPIIRTVFGHYLSYMNSFTELLLMGSQA